MTEAALLMDSSSLQRKALFKQMLHDVVDAAIAEICMYRAYSPALDDELKAYILDKLSMFLESGEMHDVHASLMIVRAPDNGIESWELHASADTVWGAIAI